MLSLKHPVKILLCLLVLVFITLVVHWPVLSSRVHFLDDDQYLDNNLLVRNPSWISVGRFFSEILEPSTVAGYYQPLALTSLMLDCALGGDPGNLFPFHRTSLALHIMNTLLVFTLLYLLFGRAWLACGITLLFGLHPMTVEPIAWVAERKTLLAAFFSLASLVCYTQYTGKKSRSLYGLGVTAYILALLSKPTSIPLPLLMLLLDIWPLGRFNKSALREKIPFFILALAAAVITIISQSRAAAIVTPDKYGLAELGFIFCHNIIFYLSNILWPVTLSPYYPIPVPLNLSHPAVLAGVVGTCILVPLLIFSVRKHKVFLIGWLFFFIAIFPTMGLIGFTIAIAFDKYAYLPCVGLLLILIKFFAWLCGPIDGGRRFGRGLGVGLMLLGLIVAESLATRRQLTYWKDSFSLYHHSLLLAPDDSDLHCYFASFLRSQGHYPQAREHLSLALQLDPHNGMAYNNLGNVCYLTGEIDQAVAHLSQAVQLAPHNFKIAFNLGLALARQNSIDAAVAAFRRAVQLRPNDYQSHEFLARALAENEEHDQALEECRIALHLQPFNPEALHLMGKLLAGKNLTDQAIDYYRRVLQLDPEHPYASKDLQNALENK